MSGPCVPFKKTGSFCLDSGRRELLCKKFDDSETTIPKRHLESPTRAQLSVASQLFPLSRQAWMKASGPSGPERSPALRSRRISQLSLAGFLRLRALDLWSRIILGRGGHPVHCRILSSLPGLCSLESQYYHLPPAPHPDVTP